MANGWYDRGYTHPTRKDAQEYIKKQNLRDKYQVQIKVIGKGTQRKKLGGQWYVGKKNSNGTFTINEYQVQIKEKKGSKKLRKTRTQWQYGGKYGTRGTWTWWNAPSKQAAQNQADRMRRQIKKTKPRGFSTPWLRDVAVRSKKVGENKGRY